LHTSPPQHVSPLAPQGSQVIPPSPRWHDRLEPQAVSPPPAQQVSPRLPQLTQLPPEQRAPEAVQVIGPPPPKPPPAPPAPVPPPQQVWPTAPHVAPAVVLHEPLEQVPLVPEPMQVDPLATHVPPMQQPPDWQLLAAQQA
jgi:hypothetical protein